MPSLYRRFEHEPEKALETLFAESYYKSDPVAFVWQGGEDKAGVRYGSFKYVSKSSLLGRTYSVEWADYAPSIFYTDVWYDPKTSKYVPKG